MIQKFTFLKNTAFLKQITSKLEQSICTRNIKCLSQLSKLNKINLQCNPSFKFSTQTACSANTKQAPKSNESQNTTTVIEHNDFYVEQLFTGCLASYTYYIESNGEAAIIDPLRETKPYTDLAARRGAKIKYILESHFHADFVSGHISLANKTGAKIIYGPGAQALYDIHVAKDGEEIQLGNIKLQVLHTPGHTTESSCFLLKDSKNQPHSVYTGDTLFLGEVGRPDLAVKSGQITEKDLAGMLFDSIKNKLLPLPDNVIVFPSHGAGSACGKNIGKGHMCDIGTQKKKNYALQPMSRDQFIQVVTHELPKPPQYFFYDAGLNKTGYANLEDAKINNFNAIKPENLQQIQAEAKGLVLDCRNSIDEGYIDGSINIGLNTPFAVWVGTLIDPKTPLILLTEPGQEEEAAKRLMRIGFDHIIGFVDGGFQAIKNSGNIKINTSKILNAEQFTQIANNPQNFVVDVRNKSETDQGKGHTAQTIPLAELGSRVHELPKDKEVYIYCQSGARSKMAITLLNTLGIKNIIIAHDGFKALHQAGLK
ncbi:metallo-beta-lactamase family protein (macronuclear) [Tetrahymena thermophila SB210]|uniref:Metallo-beta-lactamase family protein n=1 Tax=Tetrahymena thermophila (strain SB210) TaxID=312017 RepID=Q22PH1_TETTS|nr:metallo-beta-lactamase family protein [Tetrahymena thermophila SB210]EAR87138.1 metallo-beta-lactamase family protein [Tetrahymena thermophila SB210]|eukprot:XP_001007383.1 metallo-beta-lactamase family protein [Tetrahymena thermophila SB210]